MLLFGPKLPTSMLKLEKITLSSSSCEPKKSDLVAFTADQKANPLGSHLLQNYYTTMPSNITGGKKIESPVYVVDSPKEMPLLMHCAAKEGILSYGIIVFTGGRHHTPVLINGQDAFILESLGTSKSKVGINSVSQIALALQKSPTIIQNIYTFKDNRQVDSVSCCTDAFMAIKQAIKNKENLDKFVKLETKQKFNVSDSQILDKDEKNDPFFKSQITIEQLNNLPPEIAKYSQAQSIISNYPLRFNSVKVDKIPGKDAEHDKKSETVSEYGLRHQKISSFSTTEKKAVQVGDTLVQLNGVKLTLANTAIEDKRKKHYKLVEKMVKGKTVTEIQEAVKESSGINLISKHVFSLSEAFFKQLGLPLVEDVTSSRQELVNEYVRDEMLRQRDPKTGTAPKAKESLTELAQCLKRAATLENERSVKFGKN